MFECVTCFYCCYLFFASRPTTKIKGEKQERDWDRDWFLPGALGDVIAVICAPATSLTSVIGIDSFGTIGISR